MAVNWIASFKTIPWNKVLSVAPSIADGARKLWNGVAKNNALPERLPAPEKAYSPDPAISAIEKQMQALELRSAQIREEIALSSEILDKLAEQQSQLVQAVDILRVRTRTLLWVCSLFGLAIIVLGYLALVVGR